MSDAPPDFTLYDWNDHSSVKRLKKLVGERLKELQEHAGIKFSHAEEHRTQELKVLDAANDIIQCDLSDIFQHTGETKYYVYAHCNPTKPLKVNRYAQHLFAAQLGLLYEPFYIGKGCGQRCSEIIRRNDSYRKVKQQITKRNKEIHVVVIRDGITENQALGIEGKLIDIFGLRSYKGLLVNLDEGTHAASRRERYNADTRRYMKKGLGFDVRIWPSSNT